LEDILLGAGFVFKRINDLFSICFDQMYFFIPLSTLKTPEFGKIRANLSAEVAHLVEQDPSTGGSRGRGNKNISGSSSFGRARPCQGRGGRFEPGLPL
jgi:hypothetical protein